MEIHQILKEIGLSDKESSVYMAVLELGSSTVLPIAKKSGLKRTYCYDILSGLVEKNLVSYIVKNGRRRYKAEDPKKISNKLNNNLILYDSILPQLNSLYNNNLANKPKVSYFEGVKDTINLYNMLVATKKLDAICSPVHIDRFTKNSKIAQIIEDLPAKDYIMRELVPYGSTPANYQKEYKFPYQQIRELPKDAKLKTDMLLFDNKLVLISFGEEPHAVVIEDSSIVETQKVLFDIIWNASKNN